MILDYNYNRWKKMMNITYITERGSKALLQFNISKFKSFVEDPAGNFTNWNGKPCSEMWTSKPGSFDILNFLHELPEQEYKLITGKYNPKLYTWDIETKFDPSEFPDPAFAKFPITVISVASENLDVIEMGTMSLSEEDQQWVQQQIVDYLQQSDFYKDLGLPAPKFKYLKFESEGDMLAYFLTHIVQKAPVLSGWNSDGFDSLYIQNRMSNYYPSLNMKMGSMVGTCTPRRMVDKRGNRYQLQRPDHTLMVDMMDVVANYDLSLGNKETMALDYIAKKCVGIGKIPYDGDLEHLRQTDYRTYVFYSCIDSILVQLIAKKLRTMNIMYAQALYCKTRVSDVFSKIKATEALMFDYWFRNGVKVCPVDVWSRGERGELVGAYVRVPTPGKHSFICCNDFASLYPSTIRTCNISFENYIGCLDDGDFDEAFMERCKQDPKYFVTANNCVFKNDKIYAFPSVQGELYDNRNQAKYLVKKMDATVAADLEHIQAGKNPSNQTYPDDVAADLKGLGFDIKCTNDIKKYDIGHFQRELAYEMDYLSAYEQAAKNLGNSAYGASSHIAFAFFNIRVANSITLSGQELIHLMEAHIPKFFEDNWYSMTELHKKLGVKIRPELQ